MCGVFMITIYKLKLHPDFHSMCILEFYDKVVVAIKN